jgi:hypothetical protein
MRSLGALLLLLVLSTGARAGDVFVNGVRIYRLSNVSLEGCTVTFDAQGNVQVTAPGYEIRVQEPPPAPSYGVPAAPVPVATPGYPVAAVAPTPAASGRPGFALTTWGQQTITLPLRYEVTINGKVVRAFSAADENLLIDLSPFLMPGANLVRLTVEYDSMYGGVPPTAADRYVVRIQFGRFNGEAFAAERALVEFPRDGTQMLGTIKEFQISL